MLILSMGRWIGAAVETPYLVQPLVKTFDCQHACLYIFAFALTLKTFEGLEWNKKVLKS